MHAFALLLAGSACLGEADAPNLNFSQGLKGWEGSGFYVTAGSPRGPGLGQGVCSSDVGNPARSGMIRFVLRIPPGVSKLVFQAFAATPLGIEPDDRLDIVL